MVVLLFLLVSSFLMSFSVHCIDGVDDNGNVTTITRSLSPDSVTLARGYDAMKEDPNIYKTLDFEGIQHPGNFLICSCLSLVLQFQLSSLLPLLLQVSSSLSISSVMQHMHDEHVGFLEPLGRDPCAYFKEKDEE